MSAQLAFLLRGVLNEGWAPADRPVRIRGREESPACFIDHMGTTVANLPPQEAFNAVTRVLERHITEGQLEDVRTMLPEQDRVMWSQAEPA